MCHPTGICKAITEAITSNDPSTIFLIENDQTKMANPDGAEVNHTGSAYLRDANKGDGSVIEAKL